MREARRVRRWFVGTLLLAVLVAAVAAAPAQAASPGGRAKATEGGRWLIRLSASTGTATTTTLSLTSVSPNVTYGSPGSGQRQQIVPVAQFVGDWNRTLSRGDVMATVTWVSGWVSRTAPVSLGWAGLTGSSLAFTLAAPPAKTLLAGVLMRPSLFIDVTVASSPGFGGSGKSNYGLCYHAWVKTQKGWDAPDDTFFATCLDTVAPYTDWITTYDSGSPDSQYAVRNAHAKGVQVAACAWIYWDPVHLQDSKNANKGEIDALVDLINGGFVDSAVIGSEVFSQRGDPRNAYPMSSASADLQAYIADVKARTTGHKVPIGIRLEGGVGNDDDYKNAIAQCDFVQITYHPAEWKKPISEATAALDGAYTTALNQLAAYGLSGVELQIGETGWPTSDSSGAAGGSALCNVANASTYHQAVWGWAASKTPAVKVFYFEAFDEPQKAPFLDPPNDDKFDQTYFQACYGIWHWNAPDPSKPYVGSFTQKYQP